MKHFRLLFVAAVFVFGSGSGSYLWADVSGQVWTDFIENPDGSIDVIGGARLTMTYNDQYYYDPDFRVDLIQFDPYVTLSFDWMYAPGELYLEAEGQPGKTYITVGELYVDVSFYDYYYGYYDMYD